MTALMRPPMICASSRASLWLRTAEACTVVVPELMMVTKDDESERTVFREPALISASTWFTCVVIALTTLSMEAKSR